MSSSSKNTIPQSQFIKRNKNSLPPLLELATPLPLPPPPPPPPSPPTPYYIIQKLNQSYLTLKKDGSITFENLSIEPSVNQLWIFKHEKENIYDRSLHYGSNMILPLSDNNIVICLNEQGTQLEMRDKNSQSTRKGWFIDGVQYYIYENNVYEYQDTIKNMKFPKVHIYDPYRSQLVALSDSLEADNLLIQKNPIIVPMLTIKAPIVSYDFDGVLHLSIKPDYQFHVDISHATYHPIDFDTSDLVPFEEMFDQLIQDHHAGNQIIIVTARGQRTDKYVKEYLLKQGLLEYIDSIHYINLKSPFLKAINVVKHYDDSPKQINSMILEGINVIPIDPPINRYWIYKNNLGKLAVKTHKKIEVKMEVKKSPKKEITKKEIDKK